MRPRVGHAVERGVIEAVDQLHRRGVHGIGVSEHLSRRDGGGDADGVVAGYAEGRERRVDAGARREIAVRAQLGQTAHPRVQRPVHHRGDVPGGEADGVGGGVWPRPPFAGRDLLQRRGEEAVDAGDLAAQDGDRIHGG